MLLAIVESWSCRGLEVAAFGSPYGLLFFFFLDRRGWRAQTDFCRELELFAVAHDLDRDLVGRLDSRHLVH